MTIEALAAELTNEDGSSDRLKAVQIHTKVVAMAATSAESVIRDLDLRIEDPKRLTRLRSCEFLPRTRKPRDRQLLNVLAGAASQSPEVAPNCPPTRPR